MTDMPKLLTDISQEQYNALGSKYLSTVHDVDFLFYPLLVEVQLREILARRLEPLGYTIQKRTKVGEPFLYVITPTRQPSPEQPVLEMLDIAPLIREVLLVEHLNKVPDFKIAFDPYLEEKAGEIVDKYFSSIIGYFDQKLISSSNSI